MRKLDMPGPTSRARDEARLDLNDDCINCHGDIADEWADSLHRHAYDDPMFAEALDREARGLAFCRSCHAPEADPRHEPDARRAALGVGCVGCHVVDGEILAGPGSAASGPGSTSSAPHALRREAAFAGTAACAGCHEFAFPGRRPGRALGMQRTVGEHARSAASEQSCQSCHMPPRAGADGRIHRGHDFAVVDEPRMLAAAASISAERGPSSEPGTETVVVRLRPRALGHAFPTGDLFRRLLVRVEAEDGSWAEDRYLSRHFAMERVGTGAGAIKVELADDRVGVGTEATELRVVLPPALADRPVRWRVVYQRVLEAAPGSDRRAEVWDERELAAGLL